jgi:hypothetical protein
MPRQGYLHSAMGALDSGAALKKKFPLHAWKLEVGMECLSASIGTSIPLESNFSIVSTVVLDPFYI